MMESIKRLELLKFLGTPNPTQAEAWLTRMEEVYDLMQCIDEQIFRIAVHMLKGSTSVWWKSISRRQLLRVELIWEDFKREFN